MRIKSIHLENYLGLLEGLGRSEVDVDFSPMFEHDLRRCLLFGRNGVGKSVLLNALTPFPSQGDDRSFIVAPGRAGRKIITFDRSGTEVKCDLRWSSKGKVSGFMYLDGSQDPLPLTAKGNVGEYLRAVEEELGVTPDYLKIGRIGGRVSGFLDLGPGPRKNFIGQFMPEVAEWAAWHKNVSKRASALKSQLQGLQVELDRIEPREELDAAAARAAADCERIRAELSRHDTRLGVARGALAELDPAREELIRRAGLTPGAAFNPVLAVATTAGDLKHNTQAKIERLLESRPTLVRFVDPAVAATKIAEIRAAVARREGELGGLTAQRSTVRGLLDRALREEQKATSDLKRIQSSVTDEAALSAQATRLADEVSKLAASTEDLPGVPDGLGYDEVKAACDALSGLEGEIADLRGAFPTPDALDSAARLGLDPDAMTATAARLAETAREARTRLDTARARITTIEAQAHFHNRFKGMHCSDPRCPFEKHISQFASAAQELEAKRSEVAVLEERVSALEEEVRHAGATRSAAASAAASHARIRRHRPVYEAAGVWDAVGSREAFVRLLSSSGTVTADVLSVQRLLASVAAKRDLSEKTRLLLGVRERIEGLRALRDASEQVQEARVRAEQAAEAARLDLEAAEHSLAQCEEGLRSQRQALTLLEELAALQGRAAAADADHVRLSAVATELEQLRDRWDAAHAELAAAEQDRAAAALALNGADRALSDSRLKRARRDEYEQRVAEMVGRLGKAQAVADACHPARGAPVEFLRDFLDVTRDTVNDLLDVALRGEFRIGFSVTDSEFRVPVSKGSGRVIPDVTEASEGQLALVKTVLSLALIKQTVQESGMNVVFLDEIDGPLDRERNRERFAEIIERLTVELGLEQLFMISHNDNFAAAPAGLVLLPGHAMSVTDPGFMANKIVLADFS